MVSFALCCRTNREKVCDILIQRDADVNLIAEFPHSEETKDYGQTPFTISCSQVSCMAIFELLLDNGGDVNTTELKSKNTPLIYTVTFVGFCEDSKSDIGTQHKKMEQLVKRGANPNKRNISASHCLIYLIYVVKTTRKRN